MAEPRQPPDPGTPDDPLLQATRAAVGGGTDARPPDHGTAAAGTSGTSGTASASQPRGVADDGDNMAGVVLGGCQIESLIGRGNMGRVYRARQVSVGNRTVAVKVIRASYVNNPNLIRRFRQEAESAGRLDSPFVIPVYGSGESEKHHYLVMGFADGGSLGSYSATFPDKRLPIDEGLRLLRQCCLGLLEAERHGVVHRDLKPENILLSERDEGQGSHRDARIADFGAARLVDVDLTRDSAAPMTPRYASPEQWERRRDVDHRSDMYSLGATFYAVFTGAPAAQGTTEEELARFVLTTPFLSPRGQRPDLPLGVNRILEKMTAQRVEDRFASFADVLRALDDYEAGRRLRVEAPPTQVIADIGGTRPRWLVPMVAVVLAAVAAVVAAAAAAGGGGTDPDAARTELAGLVQQMRADLPAVQAKLRSATEALTDADRRELAPVPQKLADLAQKAGGLADTLAGLDRALAANESEDWPAELRSLRLGDSPKALDDSITPALTELHDAQAARGQIARLEREISEPTRDLGKLQTDITAARKEARQRLWTALGERADRLEERLEAARTARDDLDGRIGQAVAALENGSRADGLSRPRGRLDESQLPAAAIDAEPRARAGRMRIHLDRAIQLDGAIDTALKDIRDSREVADWTKSLDGLATDLGATDGEADEVASWRKARRKALATDLEYELRTHIDSRVGDVRRDLASAAGYDDRRESHQAYVGWRAALLASVDDGAVASTWLDAAARERLRARAAAVDPPQPPAPPPGPVFPEGWSQAARAAWPSDRAVPAGLRVVADVDGARRYRLGADPVDMVLIATAGGGAPFLIDVERVDAARFRTFMKDRQNGSVVGRYFAVVDYKDVAGSTPVFALSPKVAEAFAASVGKALPTSEQWDACADFVQPIAQAQSALEARYKGKEDRRREVFARSLDPAVLPVSGRDRCDEARTGVFGLRGELFDVCRAAAGGFVARGQAQFRPEALDGMWKVRGLPASYFADDRQTHRLAADADRDCVGFRCALALDPLPR